MADETLKFFCDDQLGKLCRWLRIIGQDAVYEREIADHELVTRAREEGRIRELPGPPAPRGGRAVPRPDRDPGVLALRGLQRRDRGGGKARGQGQGAALCFFHPGEIHQVHGLRQDLLAGHAPGAGGPGAG
jgi:hypothetical protein